MKRLCRLPVLRLVAAAVCVFALTPDLDAGGCRRGYRGRSFRSYGGYRGHSYVHRSFRHQPCRSYRYIKPYYHHSRLSCAPSFRGYSSPRYRSYSSYSCSPRVYVNRPAIRYVPVPSTRAQATRIPA